jgi:hypothetical protein
VAHAAAPPRKAAARGFIPWGPADVPAANEPAPPAEAPSVEPLSRLLSSLRALAQSNPEQFEAAAAGVAAGFQAATNAATGPGALAMATLASQLNQSATMGFDDPRDRQAPDVEPPRSGPVYPVTPVRGLASNGS